MAIEDLPVIKFEDINQNTPIAEKAEITWKPFVVAVPGAVEIMLAYVLGKGLSKGRDVLFAWQDSRYANTILPIFDDRDRQKIRQIYVKDIIKYNPLLPKE